MRDRLAEIIRNARINASPLSQAGYAEADALIENGAILPPCKVGDTVYCLLAGCERPFKTSVNRIVIQAEGVIIDCSILELFGCMFWATDFGKTIFLTREEAEKAPRGEGEWSIERNLL